MPPNRYLTALTGVNESLALDQDDVTPYEFGIGAPFRNQANLLRASQENAEQNAMEKLQMALQKQADISPSQGLAAALLAAIPTLGGYMIGSAVGKPDLPDGLYAKGMSPEAFNSQFAGGGAVGGLQGAKIGQEASTDYLTALDAAQAAKSPVYEKMAAIEQKRADELGQQASQMDAAGLDLQAKESFLPLQQAKEIAVNQAQQNASRDAQIAVEEYKRNHPEDPQLKGWLAGATPEQRKAYYEKHTGVTAEGVPTQGRVDLSAALEKELIQTKQIVDEARFVAPEIKKFGSWAALRAGSALAKADPEAYLADVRNLVDRVARTRSGAAIPKPEYEKIQSFIAGDFSLSPADVASYLEATARREERFGASALKTAADLNDPAKRSALFSPVDGGGGSGGPSNLSFEEIVAEEKAKIMKERGLSK